MQDLRHRIQILRWRWCYSNPASREFDSFKVDPASLAITPVVNPDLYQIDPATGIATPVGPTDLQLGASVEVNGKFYAFRLTITGFVDGFPQASSQLVTVEPATGKLRL